MQGLIGVCSEMRRETILLFVVGVKDGQPRLAISGYTLALIGRSPTMQDK